MVSSAAGIVSSDLRPSFRGDAQHRTRNDEGGHPMLADQLTRFQVWPPQNIPPKAQP
jgi:hypothetical protein